MLLVKLLVVFTRIKSINWAVPSQSVLCSPVRPGLGVRSKMSCDLFPVRLAGAGSGDSRTSGHLDQPPLSSQD